jgi:hypothetical protein
MNKELIEALDACLQRMERGEPLDYVLAGYPKLAGQLQPLLTTAARARSAGRAPFPPILLVRQRSRGLSLAADLRQGKIRHPAILHNLRPVLMIFLVIVFLVMSSNSILVASAKSIPGDTLYLIKRSVESTQLDLVSDSAQKQTLEQAFSERRVDETKSLIIIKRIEYVDFTGVVTSQLKDEWIVSGISVVMTGQVAIDRQIKIGDHVEVYGSTDTDGTVAGIRVSLAVDAGLDGDLPEVSPSPTPSPKTLWNPVPMTPTGSSPNAPHSEDAGNTVDQSKSSHPARSGEENSSGESTHSSRSNSGGEGDN